MAAPVLVQSGTGAVVTAASGTVGGLTATAGNFLILHVCCDGAGSGFSVSGGGTGFESLTGTDGTITHITVTPLDNQIGNPDVGDQYLGCGRALGGSILATVNTGGPDLYGRWYEFSGVASGTALSDVLENSTAGTFVNAFGTAAAITDTGVTTLGTDRLALNFIGVNDDNALGDFTGETGGDWTLASEFNSATGTDAALGLQTAAIASAGTINGGSFTMAVSDGWGVTGFALIPTPPAAFVARPLMLEYQQAVAHATTW